MKKKILAILICMLVAICSAYTVVTSISVEKQILVTQSNNSKQGDNTLITECGIYYYEGRVIEVDSGGTIIWEKAGLDIPVDAERLTNGNTLITELTNNRVIEVDSGGNIVWSYSALNGPWDAERLDNNNTLICETYNNRVIEVDNNGTIVWEKADLNMPVDAERLATGNTLITELYNNRVIEVDSGGTIIWQKADVTWPVDAERLATGNTLITEYVYGQRVIEVNSSGNIVWEYNSSAVLFDAERLTNGNTLITEFGTYYYYEGRVIEVDSNGTIVWEKAGLDGPIDAERIPGVPNEPPDVPTIEGPSEGRVGEEYEFTFKATDPDDDDVKYFIDWRDGTGEETGYTPSGTDVKVKHIWSEEGEYIIKAKAVDMHGAESDWADFEVTIVENQPPTAPIITGPNSGKPGISYDYIFNSTDPEGDPVMYFVDWGDNNTDWTEYSDSGKEIMLKHNWSKKGDYTITAKAQDIYGAESNWSEFKVEIPRNRMSINSLFLWFLERFPLLEKLLSLIRVI